MQTFLSRNRTSGLAGFTLIELLVVVAVITVLLAILMPALNGARSAAQAVQCLANIRALGQGSLIYSEDFDNRVPICDTTVTPRIIWDSAIAPYMGLTRDSAGNYPFTKLLKCPSDWRSNDSNGIRSRSYSPARINPSIDLTIGLIWTPIASAVAAPRWTDIRYPTNTIYLFENQTYGTPLLPPSFNNGSNVQYRPENSVIDTWTSPAPASLQIGAGVYSHGKTMSFLLADGHAVQGYPREVSRKPGVSLSWSRE